MSWGHDEYLYRVLRNHGTTLPDEALYMIRYHSFYPWHTGCMSLAFASPCHARFMPLHPGRDYDYLCSDRDRAMLPWILEFK